MHTIFFDTLFQHFFQEHEVFGIGLEEGVGKVAQHWRDANNDFKDDVHDHLVADAVVQSAGNPAGRLDKGHG